MKPATDVPGFTDAIAVAPAAVVRARRAPTRANDFYELTKPRMNFLVLVTTMVGYYMAGGAAGWPRVLTLLVGTAMTAASAAVFNQVVERDYDRLMPRTRFRPLPAGRVSPRDATVYGVALGVAGVGTLATSVNVLTALLGAFTLLSYVFVYTPMKRWSTLNTVVGAVPGAIPPVMGWTAARGTLGPEAAVLFFVLFFWQMPHFLAIATMYRRDYAAGGFKMLPVVDEAGLVTGRQIVLYGAALIPITLMPSLLGMTGVVYFAAALLLGLGYLSFGMVAAASRERADARKLFFASIVYLPVLLGVMMVDKV